MGLCPSHSPNVTGPRCRALVHTNCMDADDIRSVLRILGRGDTLPGLAFLEEPVTVQATLWTSAASTVHVFDDSVFRCFDRALGLSR